MNLDDFLCEREGCNHPPRWHRLDDSTNISPVDPEAQFRCLGYDCEIPGKPIINDCGCPNFIEPQGYIEAINEVIKS